MNGDSFDGFEEQFDEPFARDTTDDPFAEDPEGNPEDESDAIVEIALRFNDLNIRQRNRVMRNIIDRYGMMPPDLFPRYDA